MLQIKFLPFGAKSVHLSVKLPLVSRCAPRGLFRLSLRTWEVMLAEPPVAPQGERVSP